MRIIEKVMDEIVNMSLEYVTANSAKGHKLYKSLFDGMHTADRAILFLLVRETKCANHSKLNDGGIYKKLY